MRFNSMNLCFISLLVLMLNACTSNSTSTKENQHKYIDIPEASNITIDKNENLDSIIQFTRINKKVKELNQFLKLNPDYNQDVFFLIDMRILSNYKRFFVYDNIHKKIIYEGLVAHGSGSETDEMDSLYFCNTPNSNCSSLGKYRVSYSYSGQFGKSYKLYGLDKTNSNAFDRAIVLHKFKTIPDVEQNYPITLSLGCPMVSNNFFSKLEKILDNSDKEILMCIYY